MNLQERLKNKQPLSLKWKWGILLFLFFAILTTFSITLYHQVTLSTYQDQLLDVEQAKFTQLIRVFEESNQQISTPPSDQLELGQTRHSIDKYNLVEIVTTEYVVVRLLNTNNQIVYQSQPIDFSIQAQTTELLPKTIEGQNYLVGQRRLYGEGQDNYLGTIQYIVLPSAWEVFTNSQEGSFWRITTIFTLISLIIAFIISNYFLRPLTYLNNSLDMVEEESLSQLRVMQPSSKGEWSDLSLHVNRLLDKIDLYVSNQKQFVEDVSHELRTPVAIVEGHLKMLNRWGKEDPKILDESISASLQEMTRMKGLVQEMLDLSRADHVDVDYKDEVTEVIATTKQVFNNFVILHDDFQFYLDSEKDNQELYVKIFRNHFEQILIILLDNAVKYSTDRKEIHISLSQGLGKVEIAVQDFGEGMTEEDKEKVFGRFYRVDKARSRNKGGNGLGLSIAKQLVEGYRGQIRVESVYQHGSIFYVEFPIITSQRQIYKSKQLKERRELF